jgi:transposase InsO family protein
MDPFIEAEEAQGHSVARCCALFQVSRAAYYQRRRAVPSARALADRVLTATIRAIHAESDGTYGSPRVHQQLRKRGTRCGRRRVARLMRQAGLEGCRQRRWRTTPIQDPAARTADLDLIQRAFEPGQNLHRRYCGDITYLPCGGADVGRADQRC